MAEPSDRDLLREWQAAIQAIARSVTGAAGQADVIRPLLAPLQKQTELFQAVLDRERRLQRELTARSLGPFDAAFDLLEQSGTALRQQAEAVEHAALALQQAAGLMRTQAELFERTIATMRAPLDAVESTLGVERRSRDD
jgi:hypothetical protein